MIKFVHDCESCILVAQTRERDWYFCPEPGTIIGRYGDAPEEYWSMPVELLERMYKREVLGGLSEEIQIAAAICILSINRVIIA